MSGDVEVFRNRRNEVVTTIKTNITNHQREIDQIGGIERRIIEGKLTDNDLLALETLGLDSVSSDLAKGTQEGNESAAEELARLRIISSEQREAYKAKYKAWTGYNYGGIDTSFESLIKSQEETWQEEQDRIETTEFEKELMERYGTTDSAKIKDKLASMTPKEVEQETYTMKNELPPDPTIQPIEEIETDGGKLLNRAVNKEINRDEYNEIINNMIEGDYGIRLDYDKGELASANENLIRNIWGQKMLTKEEWDKATLKGEYGESYKKYVKVYNSVSAFFDEYYNPRKEDVNRLDSFLEGSLSMKSMKKAFGGIAVGKDKVHRKWWTPGDRRKLRKIHKLYKESNLTLEQFKEQYKTEYLNMVRIFKYGASIKQSHSKIEQFEGDLPIPLGDKLSTQRTYWHSPFRQLTDEWNFVSPALELGPPRTDIE